MLWPGLSSTYYDQIALWFYVENVTHLAMPGIAKAHLTWNSVKEEEVKFLIKEKESLVHDYKKRLEAMYRGVIKDLDDMKRQKIIAENKL